MPNSWFVVDAHNQYIPQEAVLASKGTKLDLTRPEHGAAFGMNRDMEGKLRMMDEAGIDAVLSHCASLNILGLDFCKAMNDGNARVARDYPDRVIPLAHLPLDGGATPEGLRELDRCILELGFKGVALESSTMQHTLGSEDLYPLYKRIDQLDVPIVVHPGVMKHMQEGSSIESILKSGIKSQMLLQASTEIEDTTACIEVMFGVLNRFPNLKFLMPHHGGALPIWQGRMKLTYVPEGFQIPEQFKKYFAKTPRIRQLVGLDQPFQEILDKLYFDTAGFGGWMPITTTAVSIISAKRLCFGTDYGLEMNEAADVKLFIDNIKGLDIPEQDKRDILGENIRHLFKL
ncbi:MAG: amidohydrolase family protein [Thermaerobacter sp.]|nr:amidohydrolase family protein [Thermaerobacter sp.]